METFRRTVSAFDDPEPVLPGLQLADTAGDGVFTRVLLRKADETESRLIVFAEETSSRMVGVVGDPEPVLLLDAADDAISTRFRLRETDKLEC